MNAQTGANLNNTNFDMFNKWEFVEIHMAEYEWTMYTKLK